MAWPAFSGRVSRCWMSRFLPSRTTCGSSNLVAFSSSMAAASTFSAARSASRISKVRMLRPTTPAPSASCTAAVYSSRESSASMACFAVSRSWAMASTASPAGSGIAGASAAAATRSAAAAAAGTAAAAVRSGFSLASPAPSAWALGLESSLAPSAASPPPLPSAAPAPFAFASSAASMASASPARSQRQPQSLPRALRAVRAPCSEMTMSKTCVTGPRSSESPRPPACVLATVW
mmetsp:Transcript_16685/g.51252  ORF Transcript_16685/g.51252 Transcript_16685/m.51252 type:complete len:235 (+) Transcript_16685:1594-2298(+)